METRRVVHPSAETLRAFSLGKLQGNTASAVRSHLDGCSECRSEVAAATNDDLVNRPRTMHPRDGTQVPANSLTDTGRRPQPPLGPTTLFNLPPELADYPDYEVLRELGRGGMGVVYQAKHRLSGRMEVLKVMTKALIGQAESRERFLREIQSAARLDHRNVVKMYTALERGELMILVMEYVEGEDLAQVVKTRGPLSLLNACYYVHQAAAGLQHAFEKGMVHRDIKPQNLMLLREGKRHTVKILDFGLAKATRGEEVNTGLTGSGAMMGTPGYVAPEQILDAAKADIRADVYSLGCTLYHLLAGTPPFSGKSLFEILQAHHSVEARSLHLIRPEVPEELAAVARKMMAKNPAQRYQTPAEVVRALDPFVKGGPKPPPTMVPAKGGRGGAAPPRLIQETMIEGSATIARWRKATAPRRSKKWLLVPLALVLLAGLAGLGVVLARRAKTPAEGADETSARVARNVERPTPSTPPERKAEEKKSDAPPEPPATPAIPPRRKAEEKKSDAPPEPPATPAPKKPAPTVTNSLGMKFAWCPPGTFQMGSPPGEALRYKDETQHKVTLTEGFSLGIHEVTQAQWKAVMPDNPSNFKGDNLPVEKVSWTDCQEFCTKLGQRDGKRYRLPTEAEWEYACRAGSSTAYCFGDDAKQLGAYAWYHGNAKNKTHEIGTKKANAWGLYDMHGNVYEWCQDGYGPYPEGDIRDPKGSNSENARVLRGGAWCIFSFACSCAHRDRNAPGSRCHYRGCRVVRCLD